MMRGSAVGLGGLAGAILGYPISYFLQPGALRAKLSIADYVQHIGDIMQSKDLAPTAIGVWVGSVVVFAILGAILHAVTSRN